MAVNPEIAGRVFPPTEPYLVGREKIREFARAVFSENPLNLDEKAAKAAGYSDVVAPPTFPIVVQESTLAQLLRFSYTRPIVAGDELTATLTVTSVKSLGGHSMVTSESSITDSTGAHVVTATSTLVVRGDE